MAAIEVLLAPMTATDEVALAAAEVRLATSELRAAVLVAAGMNRDWTSLGRPVNHDGVDPAANSDAICE